MFRVVGGRDELGGGFLDLKRKDMAANLRKSSSQTGGGARAAKGGAQRGVGNRSSRRSDAGFKGGPDETKWWHRRFVDGPSSNEIPEAGSRAARAGGNGALMDGGAWMRRQKAAEQRGRRRIRGGGSWWSAVSECPGGEQVERRERCDRR